MKSCGIIAEYNPFHNGHAYHLQEAKKRTGSEVMVVSMSGNFTQRGEPAIADKWTRAQMALAHGADLVVEQSVLGTVQSTDLFARAGVRTLQALGCDALSFGAESGKDTDFIRYTDFILKHQDEINEQFQAIRNDGRTYAAQMQQVVSKLLPHEAFAMSIFEPNNQLGLAYLKENDRYSRPMEPMVIERVGAKHHDDLNASNTFASGTALRTLIQAGKAEEAARWMPEVEAGVSAVSWENYWPLLRYRVLVEDEASLRTIYQMEEGIEYRLKKMVVEAESFHHYLTLVKNKRWTWVRLQRLCVAILLSIKKEDVETYFQKEQPIRVLGFTEKGQQYLSQRKKMVQLITNLKKQHHEQLAVEIKADQVYRLGNTTNISEQNYTRSPIRQ
ncbi:nucleotidyltransferase [Jeotgalibaca caeni]|uniref:nucleotidyltransferase n=1 Tax=Jeotgalibaca caeni TaxID=3028623 RepID=UPI00237DC4A5|nr:nucleotidyltransferase [Jeotgalibaca caeni]MDE1547945.1 nucleotidyltransferase [Jeotgalibaca caeni]